MTSCDSTPHREISRSFETERIASHRITLSLLVPPSPLLTFTCSGISRCVEVSGKIRTRSAGPALKHQLRGRVLVSARFARDHGSGEDRRTKFRPGVDRPCGLKCRRLESHPIPAARPAMLAKLFVLAKFRVSQIRPLKEQTASLVFHGPIKHFLERSICLLRHFREAAVCRGTDADCSRHANVYTQLSTN